MILAGWRSDVGAAQPTFERGDAGGGVAVLALLQRHDHVRIGLGVAVDRPAAKLDREIVKLGAIGKVGLLRHARSGRKARERRKQEEVSLHRGRSNTRGMTFAPAPMVELAAIKGN